MQLLVRSVAARPFSITDGRSSKYPLNVIRARPPCFSRTHLRRCGPVDRIEYHHLGDPALIIAGADDHVVPIPQKPLEDALETARHRNCQAFALIGLLKSRDLEPVAPAEILQDDTNPGIFNGDRDALPRIIAGDLDGCGTQARLRQQADYKKRYRRHS